MLHGAVAKIKNTASVAKREFLREMLFTYLARQFLINPSQIIFKISKNQKIINEATCIIYDCKLNA